MKNFKLLQIVPSLESGGVEQGTIDLANFLGEKKIKSFIISNGGKMLNNLNHKMVNHIKMPVHKKNFIFMPILAKKLNKIIQEKKINIVHVRSRAPAWVLYFIPNQSFRRISTFHNVYGTQNFLKKNYNKSLSEVDEIVAISEYVKSSIIEIYKINKNKIVTINRGIDTKVFDPKTINKKEISHFVNKFNIENDKKIILFPGRLTQWKGQIEFLKIMEYFKNKKVICYFVGDKKNYSYTSKLNKAIKKKNLTNECKVIGNLKTSDLKIIYFCSDVIVSAPLKPEGFGRIVAEGLAMKKIVLGYNYGGVKDQLMEIDKLHKVKPHDHLEMKNKIEKVFKLTSIRKENLGKLSRLHIVKNFSKDKMLKAYLNLYRNKIL